MTQGIELLALDGIPEVSPGDDLAALICAAAAAQGIGLTDDDIVVVTQKIVSKAEGRVVDLATVDPSAFARQVGERWGKDPRQIELVLRESTDLVRMGPGGLIISRTRHGFVCANAGVDLSNVGGADSATLLPVDPDTSALELRDGVRRISGAAPAVILSDSFGRPWRNGIVDVALGAAGLEVLIDLRGQPDADGREMHSTVIAVADELASAADLAAGKTSHCPVVVIRGYRYAPGAGRAAALVMDAERDLFR
ncbi:MAG: coenzyme F420-0:L-glutamate ligase [Candidatus Limnocylindria bacterium]